MDIPALHTEPCVVNGMTHTTTLDTGVSYCVYCLHKLTVNLPVKKIELNKLCKFNEISWGPGEDIMQIIADPNCEHFTRIKNADMKHPILVYAFSDGVLTILDGCHRLAFMYIFGIGRFVNIQIVPTDILEKTKIIPPIEENAL